MCSQSVQFTCGCDSPITSNQVTYLRELASPCQFSFLYDYTLLPEHMFVNIFTNICSFFIHLLLPVCLFVIIQFVFLLILIYHSIYGMSRYFLTKYQFIFLYIVKLTIHQAYIIILMKGGDINE